MTGNYVLHYSSAEYTYVILLLLLHRYGTWSLI